MYKFFSCFILFLLLTGVVTEAQDASDYKMGEIIVSASRVPIDFSILSRSVVLITPREIDYSPISSITDLLKNVPGVDLRTRGVDGIQSDIGIRGGSFEQTLILIDGIKLSDPQTGHHNLNLPVPLEAVERIEVLKGQGSRIYGANAFSGAVNIITRKEKGLSFAGQITGGDFGLWGISLYNASSIGILANNISFSKEKSDGYRTNTAFDNTTFFYNGSLALTAGELNFIAGYNDKTFGANNFYADKYPYQWEHTTTKLAGLTGAFKLSGVELTPKLYWRRNDDDYILDNTRPAWYRNIHQSNTFGGELQGSITTPLGITSLGGELVNDKIESTNLGSHNRTKGGVFAEQTFSPLRSLNASAGFYIYNYSSIGWKMWPGIDVSYLINANTKLFASAGKAFRIPTFTELYYKSPANMGNPDLKSEETVNYEFGASYSSGAFELTGSLFYKEGKNIIDWVKNSENDIWRVMNETTLNTSGFEAGVLFFPGDIINNSPIVNVALNYTYLNMDRSTSAYQSKYALDHLKHQVILSVANNLPFGIKQNWIFRYESRENFKDNFITDTQILREISYFTLVLKASNLFNKSYMDIGGIPLPGRWISAELKFYKR